MMSLVEVSLKAVVFCAVLVVSIPTTFALEGTVTADLSNPGQFIPSTFVGFGVDTPDIIADNIFTPNNVSLLSLLSLLGPNGVLRIGGADQDSNPPPPLNQQIANDLGGFVSALGSGWSVVYGLDSRVHDTGIAVTHVGYLLNAISAANIAFQVGNEPDFADESIWVNTFNRYYQALTGTYGPLNYGAPDVAFLWNVGWANDTVLAGGYQYITGHKYWLGGCSPLNPPPSNDTILADATVVPDPGVSISEFGIICDGGQQGITDRLLAATYYLRLAQSAFAGGFAGIWPLNVLTPKDWDDGFRVAYYNQFVQQPDGGWSPAPMFYGMYLFAQLQGQTSIATTVSTGLNGLVSAIATIGSGGDANILVINLNTDPAREIIVKPQQTRTWSIAHVYLLSGQDCQDPAPVLNGQPIGEGGSWTGSAVTLSMGQSFAMPACGAALIYLHSQAEQL